MYCFVPSWYSGQHPFHADAEENARRKQADEFDDTVNQLRMFLQAKEDVQLLSLAYAPNLRHFMYRQNILMVPVWSAFDVLQGVRRQSPGLLSFRDLPWPEHTQWFYTPFGVSAYLNGQPIAVIGFGRDGNMILVDHLQERRVVQRDWYDDRGFLSSCVIYEGERAVRQEYLDPAGNVRLAENLLTGSVSIPPDFRNDFSEGEYPSMQELLREVLSGYLHSSDLQDAKLVVASNAVHNDLVFRSLAEQPVTLSYFGDRFDLNSQYALTQDVSRSRMIVSDTEHTAKRIRAVQGEAGSVPIYDISPFDTRLSLGKSQQIKALKVFLPIDGFKGEYLEKALAQTAAFMKDHASVELHLGVQTTDFAYAGRVRRWIGSILTGLGYPELAIAPLPDPGGQEDSPEGAGGEQSPLETLMGAAGDGLPPRVFIRTYAGETELIQILRDVRLIVDVRDQPDLYLQIAGISTGIPQVNYRFTRYVEHCKNGFIIQNIDHLTEGLDYYLSGLNHWNEALVYCIQEIGRYRGGALVTKWKEMERDAAGAGTGE